MSAMPGTGASTRDLPTPLPRIAGGKLTCFVEDPETDSSIPSVFTIRSAVAGLTYPW
ncbi:hypothetical protein ACFL3X_01160 [Gemmatimonadota bacterium]